MNSMNVSRASTEKAPRGISQVDYEALDRIDDLLEEIIESDSEQVSFADEAVSEVDEDDAASTDNSETAKNNKVENTALITTNTGSAEAKPTGEMTKKGAGTAAIPPELLKEMDATANRIRDLHEKSVKNLVAIGRDLIAMKSALKHGQFTKWYKHEFGWNGTTVKRYMDGARGWDEIVKLEPDAKVEILPHQLLHNFGNLSEAQQLEIVQATKAGLKVRAADYKPVKVPASSRTTDNSEAEALAKLIAGELTKGAAMNISKKPGFEAPVFGKLLRTAITATFSGSF